MIDDGTNTRRRWRWELWVIAVLILGALILPAIPAYQVRAEIDSVTGSTTTETVSLFGLMGEVTEEASPLELWLQQHGEKWTPDWRLLHDDAHYLFGARFGHGVGAPIHRLLSVLGDFIATSTDEEIREFVRVMESGTFEEQEAAVQAAERRTRSFKSP